MATNPPPPGELISTTLEEVLVAVARGIGEAQAALDAQTIDLQRRLDEDPVMAQYGLSATWYQMPNTQLQLKVAVDLQESGSITPPPPIPGALGGFMNIPRMHIAPLNARYLSQFSYDAQAATTLSLTIVPVPPGGPSTSTPPTHTDQQVTQIASQYLKADDPTHPQYRLTVNYNPQARVWYVIQSLQSGDQLTLEALVKIDDVTGSVIKHVLGG